MSNPAADTYDEYAEHAAKALVDPSTPRITWSRQAPRNFALYRKNDITGVSGTGTVAWGTEFPDGTVVLRWCVNGTPATTVVHESIESIVQIHGHGGATEIVWYH